MTPVVRRCPFPGALLGVLLLALAAPAGAQHAHGAHGHHGTPSQAGAPPSPYAGLQDRAIKALSDEQIADLRAGKGMSLALPAELNGYPGPAHALELAEPLGLSTEQKARAQALFERMQAEARAAGAALIEAEAALERLFRERTATPESLQAAVARAAAAQGALRETHLRYHLQMMDVLSPQQVAAYHRLRGY